MFLRSNLNSSHLIFFFFPALPPLFLVPEMWVWLRCVGGCARPSCLAVDVARPSCSAVDVTRPPCSAVDVARPPCSAVDIARPSCSAVDVARPPCSAVDVARPPCLAVDVAWPPCSAVDVVSPPVRLWTSLGPPVRLWTSSAPLFGCGRRSAPLSLLVFKSPFAELRFYQMNQANIVLFILGLVCKTWFHISSLSGRNLVCPNFVNFIFFHISMLLVSPHVGLLFLQVINQSKVLKIA
ncbi:hypothetical protein Q7C36_009971 [Tachysurus vachellii]|uniref:Uncharacterized protein n=1 Tax=Tachysurus vachellii TaxID=175792 RepID=A0AA88MZB1_TACVA|nr:hypothetical protein Q7C36_009971 [Tachysurus vachellii]